MKFNINNNSIELKEDEIISTNRIRGFELIDGIDGKLPEKQTKNSACVDFFANCDITVPAFKNQGKATLVPTGVKAYMPSDECLKLYNRSSIPVKLGLIMSNGVRIVDSDYYNNPDNEGHIMFEFNNLTNEHVIIKKGTRIGQDKFEKILPIDNMVSNNERTGGFGSTGNK